MQRKSQAQMLLTECPSGGANIAKKKILASKQCLLVDEMVKPLVGPLPKNEPLLHSPIHSSCIAVVG